MVNCSLAHQTPQAQCPPLWGGWPSGARSGEVRIHRFAVVFSTFSCLIRHGLRRATFPRGEGFELLNYNLSSPCISLRFIGYNGLGYPTMVPGSPVNADSTSREMPYSRANSTLRSWSTCAPFSISSIIFSYPIRPKRVASGYNLGSLS